MAGQRKVRRSTHGATSACVPTPPSASRRLEGMWSGIDELGPDSRSYRPDSAFYTQRPAADEALLRNEGAVGSNPITSTTNRPETPFPGGFTFW